MNQSMKSRFAHTFEPHRTHSACSAQAAPSLLPAPFSTYTASISPIFSLALSGIIIVLGTSIIL